MKTEAENKNVQFLTLFAHEKCCTFPTTYFDNIVCIMTLANPLDTDLSDNSTSTHFYSYLKPVMEILRNLWHETTTRVP